jgi:hypothetical protein
MGLIGWYNVYFSFSWATRKTAVRASFSFSPADKKSLFFM